MDETIGIIEELFTDDEDIVNDLEEDNEIDEPDEDPSIPTEDEDTGEGGDSSPVEVVDGETIEPDEEDTIDDEEENDLTEYEIAVDEEEVLPVISNEETLPTIGNVEQGDRVMIALINGEPTVIGTVGSGDKQQSEITTISADVAALGTVVAGKASIQDLTAATGRITTLETDNVSVKSRLDAAEGNITSLTTNKANISDLNAATARIGTLETSKANVSDLNASNARISTLETNALTADSAVITNLQTNKVNVSDLQANYITANQIEAAYAKVNASNIDTATIRNAWIDKLMVQSGLLAHSGTIYTLDAIQLNADRITAGTIDVQRLIVTVNNQKYMVQFDAQGNPTYVKLDGDVIEDLTITADKIVAGAITADKITTNNIVGTGGWINLRSGTFNYTNAISGNGISWDGTNLSILGGINITNQLNIVKNGDSVASFGENVQVGSNESAKLYITNQGINAEKQDGSPYFSIGVSDPVVKTLSKIDSRELEDWIVLPILDGSVSSDKFLEIYLSVPENDTFNLQVNVTGTGSNGDFEYNWDADFVKEYDNDQQWTSSDGICTIYYAHPSTPIYTAAWFELDLDALSTEQGSATLDNDATVGISTDIEVTESTYSFGTNITSNKMLGFAVGEGTITSEGSFVCGRYNSYDENNEKAFIIGGGSTTDSLYSPPRRNLFTVGWDGSITARWQNIDEDEPFADLMRDISLFDIIYPIGSYYETSLPPVRFDPITPYDRLGTQWFDPNVAWGGTWVLETEGLVHVSASPKGSYRVNGANQADGAGAKDGGNKDAIIPYHTHPASFSGNQLAAHNHPTNSSTYDSFIMTHSGDGNEVGRRAIKNGTGTSYAGNVYANAAVGRGSAVGNKTAGTPSGTVTVSVPNGTSSGNTTNANMQPYVNVYRWHRVA